MFYEINLTLISKPDNGITKIKEERKKTANPYAT
jgi:hypothetical protein